MSANSPKAITDAIRRQAVLSPLDDGTLGKAAGCGREHMNAFRNYRKGMGLARLCKLADFLGLKISVVRRPQREGIENA